MNQTENRSDVVAQALAWAQKADEIRGDAIAQLLAQREQIERDLKTLGYVPGQKVSGVGVNGTPLQPAVEAAVKSLRKGGKQFRGLTLAQVGRTLLEQHGRLHGKVIEELARAGGFKGGARNFQNYLPVAFKRDGGFENIGGNTWRLKDSADAK